MLTQEQIDAFHRDGYLIMRGVIQGKELEWLQKAVDEVQRQGEAKKGENHLYKPVNGEQVYWRSEKMWTRGEIFKAVTVNPDLLENIGQIVGEYFFPVNDSLVIKLPKLGAPVKWHQDPPFNSPKRTGTHPFPNFTTDIYLDHSDPDNGCVYAIPGHHLIGHVDLSNKSEEELFESYGAVPVIMEPGDVLFHCVSTPHGSRPNYSNMQRRVFYVHFLSMAVIEEAYPQWLKSKPGVCPPSEEYLEGMLASRKSLGINTMDDRNTIQVDQNGFRFIGLPCTPRNHWKQLIDNISPEEKSAKKMLKHMTTDC